LNEPPEIARRYRVTIGMERKGDRPKMQPISREIALLIRAGNTLISIETADEQRAVEIIRQACDGDGRTVYDWSMTQGLRPLNQDGFGSIDEDDRKPRSALHFIRDQGPAQAVYIFKDFAPHGRDAEVHRTLRDLLPVLAANGSAIVLVDSQPLPDEVRRLSVAKELGWPSAEELEEVVKETFNRIRKSSKDGVVGQITKREMEQLVQTLRGLSCEQAGRVVSEAILDDSKLSGDDIARVVESKRTLLGTTGCLEAIAVDFSIEDVAGLSNLKSWLKLRRDGYTSRATEFGLEPPRGVLMLGVPGCGKSLCAKAVAADWKMPLLRLDPGVLYQKYIGESESQLRRALAQAEAMAPVVMWIDEIEKAFASASSGSSSDGGLSKRMFGTLLSWMQDHRHPIFTIATANDVSALPPELMRKGRFDEVFFIDLPTESVRAEVVKVHLRRRQRDPANYRLAELAAASEGFSGSELEQVVVSGLFDAFAAQSELKTEHLLEAIRRTKPLSTLAAETIGTLREWASDRCVNAD
jgi:AAA+ superfamily predicted ATPase